MTQELSAVRRRQELNKLRKRDREVRAHEQAHLAAAGALAQGGATYETVQGPDGRGYAVGGEVQIQLREGRTPEETVRLARQAQRAALAPANPSAQDRAVAAKAAAMAVRAQAETQSERIDPAGETKAAEQAPGGASLAGSLLQDLLVDRILPSGRR